MFAGLKNIYMKNLVRANRHKKAKPEGILHFIILHITEALIYFIPPNSLH